MNFKNKLVIPILFISTLTFSQELETLEKNVIQITAEEIRDLFTAHNGKYSLLYSYASWCKPCEESIDTVLNLSKKESIELYIVIVDKIGSFYFEKTIESLYLDHNYTSKVYKPSPEYGRGYHKSYNRFIQELIPGAEDYGMSFFALFDKQGNNLYQSTYEIPKSESIKKIDELTN